MDQLFEVYDPFIERVQTKTWIPTNNIQLNTPNKDTIFKINNMDNFLDIKKTKFYINGRYLQKDEKEYPKDSKIQLIDNFVPSLFSKVEVKIRGKTISEIDDVRIVSTIKGVISYSLDCNGPTINSGFVSKFKGGGTFCALGNLSQLGLPVFKDYPYPLFNCDMEICFTRNTDNDALLKKDIAEQQMERNITGKTIKIDLSNRYRSENPPVFCGFVFQTNKLNTQDHDPGEFDHCKLRNYRFEINGISYPAERQDEDITNNKFCQSYEDSMAYKLTYHKNTQELPLMYDDPISFKIFSYQILFNFQNDYNNESMNDEVKPVKKQSTRSKNKKQNISYLDNIESMLKNEKFETDIINAITIKQGDSLINIKSPTDDKSSDYWTISHYKMPDTRCAVALCSNNKKLCNIWINACRRKDTWNPKTSTVCSIHFIDDDFEADLRSQLMNIKIKRKLKPQAIPTQCLKECSSDISTQVTSRQQRANKRTNENIVKNLILPTQKIEDESPEDVHPGIEDKYEKLFNDHEKLKTKYKHLAELKRNQKNRIIMINKKFNLLSQKFGELTSQTHCLEEALKSIFSQTQLSLITKQRKKVIWGTDDISKAFTIRYLSKRCYIYLRNKLHYPLPHVSTLVKWASRLSFRQGILLDVIRIMKIAALNFNELDKICVIQFDEMKIQTAFEYDKKNDQLIGPYRQMQVIMVRGLFKNWKQPIYVDFDQIVTPEILYEVIFILHDNSYKVVACVSDCGGANIGLWNKLNISIENTYFLHPTTNDKIYYFANAPHLLKLTRNWLIDTGFILSDGSNVNSTPLKELLKITKSEISTCHKLSEKHIECVKAERQNVGLAARLLSHSVATALCHYKPGFNKILSENTGKFIEVISNWYDIMNSYTSTETLCTKKAYGLNLSEQNKAMVS
ncbi:hypothetical protein QTP88_021138 [Uroleucon formosanum]